MSFGLTTLDRSAAIEEPLSSMRAAFCVDTFICQSQALDWPAAHQVLLHNLRGIRRLHMAVPHGLRVNHHGGPVLALVKAHGLIDAHGRAQPCGFRQLLQLRVEFAFSIGGAGRPGSIGGTCVMANKDMAFKRGQAVFLLGGDEVRPE
jgi:hypothetical protein